MTQPLVQNQSAAPQLVGDPKQTRIFAVTTIHGENWILGGVVPGSERAGTPDPQNPGHDLPNTAGSQALEIKEMYEDDDGSIQVYALAVPGAEFSNQQVGVILTLSASHISKTMKAARIDLWVAMQQEMSDQTVARLVSTWTQIPSDLIMEHLEEMREELEEAAGDTEPEPPEAGAPVNGTTAGAPS